MRLYVAVWREALESLEWLRQHTIDLRQSERDGECWETLEMLLATQSSMWRCCAHTEKRDENFQFSISPLALLIFKLQFDFSLPIRTCNWRCCACMHWNDFLIGGGDRSDEIDYSKASAKICLRRKLMMFERILSIGEMHIAKHFSFYDKSPHIVSFNLLHNFSLGTRRCLGIRLINNIESISLVGIRCTHFVEKKNILHCCEPAAVCGILVSKMHPRLCHLFDSERAFNEVINYFQLCFFWASPWKMNTAFGVPQNGCFERLEYCIASSRIDALCHHAAKLKTR